MSVLINEEALSTIDIIFLGILEDTEAALACDQVDLVSFHVFGASVPTESDRPRISIVEYLPYIVQLSSCAGSCAAGTGTFSTKIFARPEIK